MKSFHKPKLAVFGFPFCWRGLQLQRHGFGSFILWIYSKSIFVAAMFSLFLKTIIAIWSESILF